MLTCGGCGLWLSSFLRMYNECWCSEAAVLMSSLIFVLSSWKRQVGLKGRSYFYEAFIYPLMIQTRCFYFKYFKKCVYLLWSVALLQCEHKENVLQDNGCLFDGCWMKVSIMGKLFFFISSVSVVFSAQCKIIADGETIPADAHF